MIKGISRKNDKRSSNMHSGRYKAFPAKCPTFLKHITHDDLIGISSKMAYDALETHLQTTILGNFPVKCQTLLKNITNDDNT